MNEREMEIIKTNLRFVEDSVDNAEIALVTGDYGVAWDLLNDSEQALTSTKRIVAVLRDQDMAVDHG